MTIKLFEPLKIKELTFKNRIFVSPMCQYSAIEGVPNDWHFVHLGAFATGGAALVIAEATAVCAEGRISYGDTGLWNDDQEKQFTKIATFIKAQGSIPGIQLAHAGRKASTDKPWHGGKSIPASSLNGWQTVAPSAIKFSEHSQEPQAMTIKELVKLVEDFKSSAQRAVRAGMEVIELHMAHGYLLHQFLSPLSNQRTDDFGGDLKKRMKLPLEVVKAVRAVVPSRLPLFVRISATDWAEGGWDLEQSVELVQELKKLGVDFIDVSTGGLVPKVKIPVGPHYQVPFAEEIRKQTRAVVGAVGMITDPASANGIIENGQADAVLLAREMLRNPHWALHAAKELGAPVPVLPQYERGYL